MFNGKIKRNGFYYSGADATEILDDEKEVWLEERRDEIVNICRTNPCELIETLDYSPELAGSTTHHRLRLHPTQCVVDNLFAVHFDEIKEAAYGRAEQEYENAGGEW